MTTGKRFPRDRIRGTGAVGERVVSTFGDEDTASIEDLPEPTLGDRTPITEDAIPRDLAMVQRVARRLQRYVRGVTNGTLEIVREAERPRIDEPTRAAARRLLARAGFIRSS